MYLPACEVIMENDPVTGTGMHCCHLARYVLRKTRIFPCRYWEGGMSPDFPRIVLREPPNRRIGEGGGGAEWRRRKAGGVAMYVNEFC